MRLFFGHSKTPITEFAANLPCFLPNSFDAIKSIVEELNKEQELKINRIVTEVNGFIRKLRRSFLDQSVRTALKNWDFS